MSSHNTPPSNKNQNSTSETPPFKIIVFSFCISIFLCFTTVLLITNHFNWNNTVLLQITNILIIIIVVSIFLYGFKEVLFGIKFWKSRIVSDYFSKKSNLELELSEIEDALKDHQIQKVKLTKELKDLKEKIRATEKEKGAIVTATSKTVTDAANTGTSEELQTRIQEAKKKRSTIEDTLTDLREKEKTTIQTLEYLETQIPEKERRIKRLQEQLDRYTMRINVGLVTSKHRRGTKLIQFIITIVSLTPLLLTASLPILWEFLILYWFIFIAQKGKTFYSWDAIFKYSLFLLLPIILVVGKLLVSIAYPNLLEFKMNIFVELSIFFILWSSGIFLLKTTRFDKFWDNILDSTFLLWGVIMTIISIGFLLPYLKLPNYTQSIQTISFRQAIIDIRPIATGFLITMVLLHTFVIQFKKPSKQVALLPYQPIFKQTSTTPLAVFRQFFNYIGYGIIGILNAAKIVGMGFITRSIGFIKDTFIIPFKLVKRNIGLLLLYTVIYVSILSIGLIAQKAQYPLFQYLIKGGLDNFLNFLAYLPFFLVSLFLLNTSIIMWHFKGNIPYWFKNIFSNNVEIATYYFIIFGFAGVFIVITGSLAHIKMLLQFSIFMRLFLIVLVLLFVIFGIKELKGRTKQD